MPEGRVSVNKENEQRSVRVWAVEVTLGYLAATNAAGQFPAEIVVFAKRLEAYVNGEL